MKTTTLNTERGSSWNPFKMFSTRRQVDRNACLPAEFVCVAITGKTVLIVDDDVVVRTALSNTLRWAGHKVLTATDCSEAIGMVGEQAPDLIIVDLNFPPDVAHGGLLQWDGFQLILWLRGLKNAERAKYIVITASDTAEVRRRARTLGALTVFGKPVNAVELLKLVEAEGALPW